MGIARTLLPAALAVIAALALTATSATAAHLGNGEESPGTETLDVRDEATGVPCGPVSLANHTASGGCEINAHGGAITLVGHLFGIEATDSSCEITFSGHTDSHGEGWIDNAVHTQPEIAGECTRIPCEEEPGVMSPWPFHTDEENENGVIHTYIQVEFCRQNTGGGSINRCLIHIPIIEEPGTHHYTSGAFDRGGTRHDSASSRCEVVVPDPLHPIEVATGQIELVH